MGYEKVLVVEDEEMMRAILRQLLEGGGYNVLTADSAENAIHIFSTNDVAITLTDIKMSGKDGLDLLDQIKSIDEEAIVIIMTAFSSVDTAVAALRKGAYDYVAKPFVNEDLLQTIKNAVAHRHLFQENRTLRRELRKQLNFTEIVGKSDSLQRVFDIVNRVADTSANVLIQGESGTGKELIARSVHSRSRRGEKPFLAVNCGALPESLLESELFGHTKGSFTGSIADKKGLFRSAAGGTLFLDEIGDMPLSLQVKLLRALQEHEVTPVGASIPVSFDARIIAATNKDIETEVTEGRFREDLFYRLNVVEIEVPPLRLRRDDIPLLVKHLVLKTARDQNTDEKAVTKDALAAMENYSWPGNVRELENVIERAVILSEGEIDTASLPSKIQLTTRGTSDSADTKTTLEEVERRYVMEVLESVGDDKIGAANILGIDLSTLYRKLKRYDP
ncbi:MAG: sigma-54 dependent transcriptional regulator [Pyrinomonadaceae bacterium]